MKKTPWIPLSARPVRVGVYERRMFGGAVQYSKWDGSRWLLPSRSKDIAAAAVIASHYQADNSFGYFQYRGLAAKP